MKQKKPCKHDWQLLNFGSKAGYYGTSTQAIVLLICRECEKVIQKDVEYD